MKAFLLPHTPEMSKIWGSYIQKTPPKTSVPAKVSEAVQDNVCVSPEASEAFRFPRYGRECYVFSLFSPRWTVAVQNQGLDLYASPPNLSEICLIAAVLVCFSEESYPTLRCHLRHVTGKISAYIPPWLTYKNTGPGADECADWQDVSQSVDGLNLRKSNS